MTQLLHHDCVCVWESRRPALHLLLSRAHPREREWPSLPCLSTQDSPDVLFFLFFSLSLPTSPSGSSLAISLAPLFFFSSIPPLCNSSALSPSHCQGGKEPVKAIPPTGFLLLFRLLLLLTCIYKTNTHTHREVDSKEKEKKVEQIDFFSRSGFARCSLSLPFFFSLLKKEDGDVR